MTFQQGIALIGSVIGVGILLFGWLKLDIRGLQTGQRDLQVHVAQIAEQVTLTNGRVADLEDWRQTLMESPPWQEVLLKQAAMDGKLDNMLTVVNSLQHSHG